MPAGRDTRRRSLFKSLLMDYKRLEEKFSGADSRSFNIFRYAEDIGRDKAMSMLTFHMFIQHRVDKHIVERKFTMFMDDVYKAYRRDV